jgi:hypothetical protein
MAGAHIPTTEQMFPPLVAYEVDLPFIGSTVVLHAPSVATGPVAVTAGHIASTLVLYPPFVPGNDVPYGRFIWTDRCGLRYHWTDRSGPRMQWADRSGPTQEVR